MSEAGTSKHIKREDLSLADKILVNDELEKKTFFPPMWKRYFFCRSAKNPPLPLPHRREEWRKKKNWFCYPS